MRDIPQHWAPAVGEATGPDGVRAHLRAWGWSTTSVPDALAMAHDRLREVQARFAAGETGKGSYYPRTPLREECLGEVRDDSGALAAVITRNRYGADVLTTDQLLIADVDLPPEPQRQGFLTKLFSSKASQEPTETSGPEQAALSAITAFGQINRQSGIHIYRTAAGLRVFVTGPTFAPDSDAAATVLADLGSDEVYATLCRAHESYRARLTPKPWRVGVQAQAIPWPPAGKHESRLQTQWQQRYEAASAHYATCRLLSRSGPEPTPIQAQIIELHDLATRASSDLPLG